MAAKKKAKAMAIAALSMNKKEAMQNLFAAEAVYLHAAGWQPYLVENKLRWQHPGDKQKRFLTAAEALAEQKRDDYIR